jgi:hypothetical protein
VVRPEFRITTDFTITFFAIVAQTQTSLERILQKTCIRPAASEHYEKTHWGWE